MVSNMSGAMEKRKESWGERIHRQIAECFAEAHGVQIDKVTENLIVGPKWHTIQLAVQSRTNYAVIVFPEDTVQILTNRILDEGSR
jgi:hypothetical protein